MVLLFHVWRHRLPMFQIYVAQDRMKLFLVPLFLIMKAMCVNTFLRKYSMSYFHKYDIVKNFGMSKIAGVTAVLQTAVTRCVMVPCSCLLLPPLLMSGLQYFRCIPAVMNPRGKLLLELTIIYGSLQAALPASLAVFPQV